MITTSRIRENGFKGIMILLLFTALSIKSCVGTTQLIKPIQYKDTEATFGLRTWYHQASMAFPYCEKLIEVSSITRPPSISRPLMWGWALGLIVID